MSAWTYASWKSTIARGNFGREFWAEIALRSAASLFGIEDLDSSTPHFETPHRALRQPIAVNLFKWMVLGDKHLPGEHQAAEVVRAISAAEMARHVDVRTWRGWFRESPRRARDTAVAALDSYVAAGLHPPRWTIDAVEPGENFFRDLVDGGLAASLMKPIAAKKPGIVLVRRALEYEPPTRIHLHIDAIESAALSEGNGDLHWEVVKGTAASRVLELIHSRWSPRHGTVYSELTPDLELALRVADADKRKQIRERYRRQTPDRFEAHLRRAPRPDWSAVGVDSDIAPRSVHRLLLALAGDEKFLVEDRLHVWALDLVTAALAMHALAWTDRYTTHARSITPEMVYWRPLAAVFYSDEPDGAVVNAIAAAFDVNKTECTEAAVGNLYRARRSYWELLTKLDIDRRNLEALVGRCWRVRPVVHEGTYERPKSGEV
jgi:hypothetical protein